MACGDGTVAAALETPDAATTPCSSSDGQEGASPSAPSGEPARNAAEGLLAILPVDSRLSRALADAARELSVAMFGQDTLKTLGKVVKPSEHWEGAVLVRGSQLLGFVVFGYRRPAAQMSVKFLAVDPEERRQGYGRTLLGHVREKCAEAKIQRITLTCKRDNDEALGFYQAIGYSDETVRWRRTDPKMVDVHKLKVFEEFL